MRRRTSPRLRFRQFVLILVFLLNSSAFGVLHVLIDFNQALKIDCLLHGKRSGLAIFEFSKARAKSLNHISQASPRTATFFRIRNGIFPLKRYPRRRATVAFLNFNVERLR
eukprot:UN20521